MPNVVKSVLKQNLYAVFGEHNAEICRRHRPAAYSGSQTPTMLVVI
jgi:hypothetical protein